MSLPKAFVEELRARVQLSDIIGKRTKLTRAGREFKGCCPFHKEKTPSFTVNDQKGFYHCFGCGANGDCISFLMNHDNLPFMDAVEQLAALAGLQVPKPTKEEEQKFKKQMSLYDLMNSATKYYEAQLHNPKHKKILQYLVERGLNVDTIRSFRLGFATDDAGLRQHLEKDGYKIEDMMEAGLFRESERKKGDIYPFFRARVIFPVLDLQGRVVAFGGRVMPESHGGPLDKSAPKYVNSPETAIFHKGRNLYGLSRARKVIGDGETVVVVEGYMDVIALVQAGFRAAVAPLGTALTETQIEELWKVMPDGKKNPVLCFDGDNAGQRAAARSLERILPILKPDYSVKFAFLPPQHDPDSLIKDEGVPAMQRVLDQSIGLFEMMWQEEAKDRNFSQPEAKAGFRFALEKRARQIADSNVQEFFIHEIGQKVNEVFFNVGSRSQQARTQAPGGFFKGKKLPPGAHTPYRPLNVKAKPVRVSRLLREKALIACVINYPELFDEVAEQFGMIHSGHEDYDRLRQAVMTFLTHWHETKENNGIYLDHQAVKQHLNELGYGKILDALFDNSLYVYAGFAKPGQPVEIVRQGWLEAYTRGQDNDRWKEA
ncbi:MAG TPA: DNA primase [Patescibacteria group bacterium]|nr:DNA primase [Patescibacteria group bacterium]